MPTRTISINEEAYERLSRLKGKTPLSFSEVILKYTPTKKTLPEVLHKFGPNPDLADAIEQASAEMRRAKMCEVTPDSDT